MIAVLGKVNKSLQLMNTISSLFIGGIADSIFPHKKGLPSKKISIDSFLDW